MLLTAHAYSHRQSARQFLRGGDAQSALAAAKAAEKLHATPQGGILETVCAAALHIARLPAAAASPVATEIPNRALGETEGASPPTLVPQEPPPMHDR